MAPLIGLALKILIPAIVSEVSKKIANDPETPYENKSEVPAKEYIVPAIKTAIAGNLKSKTSWIALVVIIMGILEQNQHLLEQLIGTNNMGIFISIIGAVSLWLRNYTTESVTDKATPKE